MSDRELEEILINLNKGTQENIIQKKISEKVSFAAFWDTSPEKHLSTGRDFPKHCFLIQNDTNQFVSLVLDMGSDLHWITLPEYRRKGYLSKSLRDIILPYILANLDRNQQRITISKIGLETINFDSSVELAVSVGFEKSQEDESKVELIYTQKPNPTPLPEPQYKGISEDRLEFLMKKLNQASNIVYRIALELDFAYNDDSELESLGDDLYKEIWKLERFWDDWKSLNE